MFTWWHLLLAHLIISLLPPTRSVLLGLPRRKLLADRDYCEALLPPMNSTLLSYPLRGKIHG